MIQQNPKYFAWVFGVINALWAGFVFFNKKRHDRELKKIQHDFNLDLEKRNRIHALKAAQYEKYLVLLDDFGRKYQTELLARMQPIFQSYMENMMIASDANDKKLEQTTISTFSNEVMTLMDEASIEYFKLKSESRSFKLTASDSLLNVLDHLEVLVEKSMNTAKEFITNFVTLISTNDQDSIADYQKIMNQQSLDIQLKSKELEQSMRLDIREI